MLFALYLSVCLIQIHLEYLNHGIYIKRQSYQHYLHQFIWWHSRSNGLQCAVVFHLVKLVKSLLELCIMEQVHLSLMCHCHHKEQSQYHRPGNMKIEPGLIKKYCFEQTSIKVIWNISSSLFPQSCYSSPCKCPCPYPASTEIILTQQDTTGSVLLLLLFRPSLN